MTAMHSQNWHWERSRRLPVVSLSLNFPLSLKCIPLLWSFLERGARLNWKIKSSSKPNLKRRPVPTSISLQFLNFLLYLFDSFSRGFFPIESGPWIIAWLGALLQPSTATAQGSGSARAVWAFTSRVNSAEELVSRSLYSLFSAMIKMM